jgi:hypothetical protein
MSDDVRVYRYPLNRLFCWHGRAARKLLRYSNGVDVYCSVCMRKRLAVTEAYKPTEGKP